MATEYVDLVKNYTLIKNKPTVRVKQVELNSPLIQTIDFSQNYLKTTYPYRSLSDVIADIGGLIAALNFILKLLSPIILMIFLCRLA